MVKMIAFLAMFLDHARYIYDVDLFFYIGRVSFPLFGYLVAMNFVSRSKNKEKYLQRFLMFSFVSFLPYILYFEVLRLNVLFTLFFGIYLYYIFENDFRFKNIILIFIVIFTVFELIGIYDLPLDYGFLGIVYVFLFALVIENNMSYLYIIPVMIFLNGLNIYYMIFTLCSLIFIFLFENYRINLSFMKSRLWWTFYPVHLSLLSILKIIQ